MQNCCYQKTSTEVQQKSRCFLKIAEQNKVAKINNKTSQPSLIPFTMVMQPFKITVEQFKTLQKMSQLWQKITYLASLDSQLIMSSLASLQKDPMVGPMLKIFQKINHQNQQNKNKKLKKSKIQLFRTDFFITDDATDNIKLIQYNNVSVSMAGISQRFNVTQKKLWGKQKKIIDNNSTETYANSLAKFYKRQKLEGIVLAVVQQNQTNKIDQDLLFDAVKQNSKIQIRRILLKQLSKLTSVDQKGDLFYNNQKVSIVYYRAGYSSKQNIDWESIEKCNLSNAINIPSISQFLIGTKKMQSILSKKQVMMKFLTQEEANTLIKSVIDTWDFEKEGSKQEVLQVMRKQGKDKFVLKPNQQGGKNNLFGKQAYEKVQSSSRQELVNYILTRKIKSRNQKCNLVRSGGWTEPQVNCCNIQSEVSIYGCVCSGCNCNNQFSAECKCSAGSSQCMTNCCGGYLVRSKPQGVNQGGLMAGTGAICSLQFESEP